MQPEMAEVTSLLPPGQAAIDQPDLTGRVFELKLKASATQAAERRHDIPNSSERG